MTINHWMSICVGQPTTIRLGIAILAFLGLLCACTDSRVGEGKTNLQIAVSTLGSHEIDIDLVTRNAQKEVEVMLPGAQLTFFSFVGECGDLASLRGQVNLTFAKSEKDFFLQEHIYIARVVVDTAKERLSVEVNDETAHIPTLDPLELNGDEISKAAHALQEHLQAIDQCGGTLVLQRSITAGPWGVRCGPPGQVFTECYEIDVDTGKVVPK